MSCTCHAFTAPTGVEGSPGFAHQDAAQSQDSLSGGALVDTLADALQSGAEWQQTAQMLRQKADSLDSADRYDAHMEMGMLLASRLVWQSHSHISN